MTKADDLNSPGKRFHWFIIQNYDSVPKYVEQFGFNGSQVYRTISNASSPRLETCLEYSTASGVNIHWLASGEGPWFAPNEVGRTLARKKGLVVTDDDNSECLPIDYASLVHSIFSITEPYVIEKLVEQLRSQRNETVHSTRKRSGKNPNE